MVMMADCSCDTLLQRRGLLWWFVDRRGGGRGVDGEGYISLVKSYAKKRTPKTYDLGARGPTTIAEDYNARVQRVLCCIALVLAVTRFHFMTT